MKKFSSCTDRSFRFICPPDVIPSVEDFLYAEGFRFQPEPFSPFCARLQHEPRPLGSSLAAFFGLIYIQDRSSMLPPLALSPAPGANVLDMCASPGGKSIFLGQLTGPSGFVLANEPSRPRLATLRANIARANLPQIATCSNPGEKLPLAPDSWPAILLDPPCSGWGTIKKNPKAGKIWRGDKTKPLEAIQRTLLRKAADLLAGGGCLLYSTCTTNFAEDESQTRFAETELGLERVPLQPFSGFVFEERQGGEGALLVDGAACDSQGFYLSLLRKPGGTAPIREEKKKDFHFLNPESLRSPVFDPDLLPPGKIALFNGKARFLPEGALQLPEAIAWRGALLGSFNGSSFQPEPSLRAAIPRASDAALIFEHTEDLKALFSGKTVTCSRNFSNIAIWWRDLPLFTTTIRNGRVLPPFQYRDRV